MRSHGEQIPVRPSANRDRCFGTEELRRGSGRDQRAARAARFRNACDLGRKTKTKSTINKYMTSTVKYRQSLSESDNTRRLEDHHFLGENFSNTCHQEDYVIGQVPAIRDSGSIRFMMCQLGGCSTIDTKLVKSQLLNNHQQRYDVNCTGLIEINRNWGKDRGGHLSSWFRDGESKAISSHNSHKSELISLHQPGGTGLVCRGEIIQYAKQWEKDFRHLGC